MVYLKTSLIASLVLAGSTTLAAPTGSTKLAKRMGATCDAVYEVFFDSYSIWIEAPYNGGSGCDNVFRALSIQLAVTNWQCVDDGTGMTRLWFNGPIGTGDAANTALNEMYPDVGGFNCNNNFK
jgi:hypothetical protein